MAPNTIVVIKQDSSQEWQIVNRLTINEITEYTQFKMYKFEKQAIMLLFGARSSQQVSEGAANFGYNQAFIISDREYK